MNDIKIKIENVKNIKLAEIEFPLEKSLNLIVGNNGSGKSTILLALSQAIRNSLKSLNIEDYDSSSKIEISINEKTDTWSGQENWTLAKRNLSLHGMYEGSLFYGTRFNDSRTVDSHLRSGNIASSSIVDADEYVKEKLSYILHGTTGKYDNLKRIKNRAISSKLGLASTPYFNSINGKLISQYRMSSGECLLISLLHFVYNAIFRRSLPQDKPILILIDEIELALHPIAVSRFIDLMNDLVHNATNLMVILTSHSPEVIRKVQPKNVYKIENITGVVDVVNPAYPSYVIRDIYRHDGFDFLFLVEDSLAKILVDKVLECRSLNASKLVHVVPVGGWSNVLSLQRDLLRGNVLGVGREVISILDGDIIEKDIPIEFKNLKKIFLPIKSVEKFLYALVIESANPPLKKIVNDKYFQLDSLDSLAAEHNAKYPENIDRPDKKFYFRLRKNLESRGIDELIFVQKLSEDIMRAISFEKFGNSIEKIIKK